MEVYGELIWLLGVRVLVVARDACRFVSSAGYRGQVR